MTEHELMAAKYANTAFAILFERKTTPGPSAKELAEKERRKRNNDKTNAKRKANALKNDNKQKANWTI